VERFREMAVDAAGVAGAALLSFGVWRIYPPAGFIAGGALMLAGSLFYARAH
jgi:hypothetical protein